MATGTNSQLENELNNSERADELRFAVDINRRVIGKVKPGADFYRLNMTFQTETLDAAGLLSAIHQGHAWTARHRKVQHKQSNGKLSTYRVKQNVLDVAALALDIDTEDERAALDTLAANPFILAFASFLHTTASHRPDAPRARVVFVLSEPVDVATAEAGLVALLNERFPYADKAASDASRLFYGSPGCESVMLGNVLPVDVLASEVDAYEWRQLAQREERQATRQTKTPEANAGQVARYVWNAKQRILDAVAGAPHGTRHNTLRDAAVRLGSLYAADWLDDAARAILAGAEDELKAAASCWCNGQDDEREVSRIVSGSRHSPGSFSYGMAQPAWKPNWNERPAPARATPRESETPPGESLERELERQARREAIRLAQDFFRETYTDGNPALGYEDDRIKKLTNPLQFMTTLKTHSQTGEWVFLHTRAKARRESLAQLKKDAWRLAKQIEEEQQDGRAFFLVTLSSEAEWRRLRDAWQKRYERTWRELLSEDYTELSETGRRRATLEAKNKARRGAVAWQVYRQEDKTVEVIHDDAQRAGEPLPTELDALMDLTRRLLMAMPEEETKRVRASYRFGGNYTGSRGDGRTKREGTGAGEWQVVSQLKTEGAAGLHGAAVALGIELNQARRGSRQMSHEDALLSLGEAGFVMSPKGRGASVADILTGKAAPPAGEMSDIVSIYKEWPIDTKSDILEVAQQEAFASETQTDEIQDVYAPTMRQDAPDEDSGDILNWFLDTGAHRTNYTWRSATA